MPEIHFMARSLAPVQVGAMALALSAGLRHKMLNQPRRRSFVHIWLRSESRDGERRTGLTPEGAAELIAQGHEITVETFPPRERVY